MKRMKNEERGCLWEFSGLALVVYLRVIVDY